ncbi:GNAT family N-acetyltransferase [Flavobacterium humi]|uniref:GNAT family N-acetyltransferase n=1 Tax=Flavobacterium humi TaxID=2562683 RepID=A0A4Z0L5G9_9FLAO|nr:GNAT family N-acetyltransferase [Flavobacterium humi]TGD57741.1 GNAT family N-acetyltransferase [Flavobacterium humi]
MITIKIIPSKETYPVRQPVLRAGKPIESCCFDGDDLETTVHFGLYFDKDLAGVVSVFESRNANFPEERQMQIRGMAVLEGYQKKGFGNFLVNRVEEYAKSKNVPLLWFNARETAVRFYEKLQYTTIGPAFEIQEIGTHYVMFKHL